MAALLIRRWLKGTITNYELDDQWPWRSRDRGVVDVGKETWRYYNDFPEQTLSTRALTKEEIEVLHRCLRFLESSQPYLVPEIEPPKRSPLRTLFSRVSGGKHNMTVVVDDQRKKWWPYADEVQYLQ